MRVRVLSLLSFWFGGLLHAETVRPRERERFKQIIIFKILPVVVVVVVGLNKDEFYLEHDHHPFGVVAVFDATSKFVDEYYE